MKTLVQISEITFIIFLLEIEAPESMIRGSFRHKIPRIYFEVRLMEAEKRGLEAR